MFTIMQNLFHYSSVDNLVVYPQFIRALKPFQSIQQLFIAIKLIGPFIYSLSGNATLTNEVRSLFSNHMH